jgi:hypothetical protein
VKSEKKELEKLKLKLKGLKLDLIKTRHYGYDFWKGLKADDDL